MRVLIVDLPGARRDLWLRHLQRSGLAAESSDSAEDAIDRLGEESADVVVVNFDMPGSGAVSDYLQYRRPRARLIAVTDDRFFSNGAIFELTAQACAVVQGRTSPGDLAAIIEHYGREETARPSPVRAARNNRGVGRWG